MNSQTLLLYVLKSIFISGVFAGYYWLALRNKNFNYYNRFYLLLSMVCSLVIPLFNFNWFTIDKQELPAATGTLQYLMLRSSGAATSAISWETIATWIATCVSALLLGYLALGIHKVYRLKRRSEVIKMERIDFINTTLESAPFSFLNNLFWKESISLEEDYGQKIFKHEITHIQQKHTLDVLFCQVVNSIFWMNPFNWLIQKELKAIHEFIADKEAVGNNNVEAFVQLLLQAHYGQHFLNITHAFHYSSIKRRLFMLTTSNKPSFSYARRLVVLPVSFAVVMALSVSMNESKAQTPAVVHDAVLAKPTTDTHIQKQVKTVVADKIAAKQKAKPVTDLQLAPIVSDTVPTPARVEIKSREENKKQLVWHEGGQSIVIIPNASTLTWDAKSDSPKERTIDPIFYINDKLATSADIQKLNPNDIQSIDVWKDDMAIEKFGEHVKGRGVIQITTKQSAAPPTITLKLKKD